MHSNKYTVKVCTTNVKGGIDIRTKVRVCVGRLVEGDRRANIGLSSRFPWATHLLVNKNMAHLTNKSQTIPPVWDK